MITTNFFNTVYEYAKAVRDTFVDGKIYPSIPVLTITVPEMTTESEDQAPTITTTSDGAQTLTSDNLEVATIVDGKIHVVAVGTANIKVATAATEKFKAAEASAVLTINA